MKLHSPWIFARRLMFGASLMLEQPFRRSCRLSSVMYTCTRNRALITSTGCTSKAECCRPTLLACVSACTLYCQSAMACAKANHRSDVSLLYSRADQHAVHAGMGIQRAANLAMLSQGLQSGCPSCFPRGFQGMPLGGGPDQVLIKHQHGVPKHLHFTCLRLKLGLLYCPAHPHSAVADREEHVRCSTHLALEGLW